MKDGEIDLSDLKTSASSKAASLLLQPFDVLFNRTNSIEHVGRTSIWRGQLDKISFASYLVRLVPDTSRIIPEFLNRWLNLPLIQLLIRRYATPGVHQVNINPTNLRKIWIALPESIEEQQHIVEVLNTIDSTIAHTSTLIAKLKQMKAGLLHDLLTRGLDENGKLRDAIEHPEQFKDSPLGQIPKNWEISYLIDQIDFPEGQVDPKLPPYCNWALIAPDHIESRTGKLIQVQTAAEQNAISGKYVFEAGDVIYSKIRPYLRKAVLADRRGLCSADMYPLRPHETIVPQFLHLLILGEHFSHFAESVSMRSGIPKINREELAEYRTAFPSAEEQQRIVAILEAQDERIRLEETYLNKLKEQKKGLMHDLLTGRVRVTNLKEIPA